MRNRHLQGGALLTECAAGQGAVVVVEGEHREDDAWFYGRWFNHLGPRITFFAQNGWEKVTIAVAELQAQLNHRPVFGIIDGDFEDPSITAPAVPNIHRLPRYTLENYLLEPVGWFEVVKLVSRGASPVGWASPEDVTQRLEEAYRECLELAARNRTVFDEHCRHRLDGIPFREHPDALSKFEPRTELANWAANRGAPRPLVDVFDDHLARLQAADWSVWHREVTGKAVLKVFLKKLKLAVKKTQMPDDLCCSVFLQQHPDPHQDLVAIVDSMIVAPT